MIGGAHGRTDSLDLYKAGAYGPTKYQVIRHPEQRAECPYYMALAPKIHSRGPLQRLQK